MDGRRTVSQSGIHLNLSKDKGTPDMTASSASAARAPTAQTDFPIVLQDTPLDVMADQFFRFDCLQVKGLLPPARLSYFKNICDPIYAADDARFARGDTADATWLREYENGWIWQNRLKQATNDAFGYTDIVASRRLYQILDRLLGDNWWATGASQLRRSPPQLRTKDWGSPTIHHLDAQWGDADGTYIVNVWAPLVPCGKTASSLDFLLIGAEESLNYAAYNPDIPREPRGPRGINPRFRYKEFEPEILTQAYGPEKFWFPEMDLGDVLIFSHWCPHGTKALPGMTDMRISLEWRVAIPSFDSPKRPGGMLSPQGHSAT
jgi:hypothetical protein